MRVIIMGCGRVGEQVSRRLDERGHEVVVIHDAEEVIERLGPHFGGKVVLGVGFDRDILVQAGIERTDAFAATSPSDNANIVASQIARNIYHVPRVVARLYDPRRAELYRRLGLETISTTTWGAERIYELLTHSELDAAVNFGHGEVTLIPVEVPANLVGQSVKNVTIPGEISVVTIIRGGAALIPLLGTEFRVGDHIHFAVDARALSRFETMLGLGTGG